MRYGGDGEGGTIMVTCSRAGRSTTQQVEYYDEDRPITADVLPP